MSPTPCRKVIMQIGKRSTNKDEDLLSSKDVAEILDCTPDEVITLARTGKIRATKQGKYWKFLRRDVTNYMQQEGEQG